jgi:aerobic carbon-monoxide dehydrogenase large subunit
VLVARVGRPLLHAGPTVRISVVAESRDQAEDAAERVTWDLEELPAVVDPQAVLRPESPIVHEHYRTNLIGAFSVGPGDADTAMASAQHRLRRRFYHHRYVAVPMECRGVVSAYYPRTASATIWSSTQVVHWVGVNLTAPVVQLQVPVAIMAAPSGRSEDRGHSGSSRHCPRR